LDIKNPDLIKYWYEPICTATILTPIEYAKSIKTLCHERRAIPEKEEYFNDGKVVSMQYAIPLAELIINFFDKLKSISQGYASLDYEHKNYQEADVKMVVFHLNGDPVDALTFLVHAERAVPFAK
jgi:GTP-binding protein LepA